jgi:kynurenine formamidase
MNLLTPERTLRAAREIREGLSFCLSLPLDLPGKGVLNPRRKPPQFHTVEKNGKVGFDLPLSEANPLHTDLHCDDAVLIHLQYSTQWDALGHMGYHFDADGDGVAERVYYNGWNVRDPETGQPIYGEVGAYALGIQNMAETGVQGRGVMVDLNAHYGNERVLIGYDELMAILEADKIEVEEGDFLCLHSGLGQMLMDMKGDPDESVRLACPVVRGWDTKLHRWIAESGIVAIAADTLAVEQSSSIPRPMDGPGPALPLHEACLFRLGVHLGELWYLSELAAWLRANGRSRFFLTAPPLRLPGAVGSPVTPVATV